MEQALLQSDTIFSIVLSIVLSRKMGRLKNWSNVDWHRFWLVSQLNFVLIISAVFMRTRILKAVIITFVLFSKDMLSEWNHIVGSHSKFKKFYLNFHKIYSHQNWWLRLRNFHLQVTCLFDHVVRRCEMAK